MKSFEFVVCPVCGKGKMFALNIEGEMDWVDYEPKTMEFIQVRAGGGKTGTGKKGRGQGRGVGFPKVSSMTLEDAVNDGGNHLAVAKSIAKRLSKIVIEFKRVGLLP